MKIDINMFYWIATIPQAAALTHVLGRARWSHYLAPVSFLFAMCDLLLIRRGTPLVPLMDMVPTWPYVLQCGVWLLNVNLLVCFLIGLSLWIYKLRFVFEKLDCLIQSQFKQRRVNTSEYTKSICLVYVVFFMIWRLNLIHLISEQASLLGIFS